MGMWECVCVRRTELSLKIALKASAVVCVRCDTHARLNLPCYYNFFRWDQRVSGVSIYYCHLTSAQRNRLFMYENLISFLFLSFVFFGRHLKAIVPKTRTKNHVIQVKIAKFGCSRHCVEIQNEDSTESKIEKKYETWENKTLLKAVNVHCWDWHAWHYLVFNFYYLLFNDANVL